jgi:hypothetical protein
MDKTGRGKKNYLKNQKDIIRRGLPFSPVEAQLETLI